MRKDRESYNEYMREYMRRKRAKAKEHKEDHSLANMDLNYGMKPSKEVFVSFEEWKNANPDGSFREYLEQKMQFDNEERVRPVIYDGFDEVFGQQKRKLPKKRRLSD